MGIHARDPHLNGSNLSSPLRPSSSPLHWFPGFPHENLREKFPGALSGAHPSSTLTQFKGRFKGHNWSRSGPGNPPPFQHTLSWYVAKKFQRFITLCLNASNWTYVTEVNIISHHSQPNTHTHTHGTFEDQQRNSELFNSYFYFPPPLPPSL